jgi:hypothetical protein
MPRWEMGDEGCRTVEDVESLEWYLLAHFQLCVVPERYEC